MTRRSIISGLSLVLLALLMAGCNEPENNTGSRISLLSSEQRKAYLGRQIHEKYENPHAHYELGRIYHSDGDWVKAETAYRTAVGFDPMLWDAEAALVKLFMDSGDFAKSQAAAKAAMERATFSVEMTLRLADAFQKEYLDAYVLKCHSQALALDPESPLAYKHIGYYYLQKRDMGRAEVNLRQSFMLDPYQPEVAGELGRMGIIVEVPGIRVNPTPPADNETELSKI